MLLKVTCVVYYWDSCAKLPVPASRVAQVNANSPTITAAAIRNESLATIERVPLESPKLPKKPFSKHCQPGAKLSQ